MSTIPFLPQGAAPKMTTEVRAKMAISLTPPRTFFFSTVAAYVGSVCFLVYVTRIDFPNSTLMETFSGSLLPSLPAALICGAVASHYIHREQPIDMPGWSTVGLLVLAFVSAICGIMLTFLGAMILGILGWAFASPV